MCGCWFFFVKQKTAYEMRISDWSSDVCSSDLETFLDRKFGKTVREENISPWRRTVCGDLTAAFSRYEAPKAERLPFLPRDEFIEELGRASCRARVCQDV